jgi:hydrogenase nickel incorporation protein HypA/HybF
VHELSVCLALLRQVAQIAEDRGAESIERITIEVGPLSGVEPDLLAGAFSIARAGGCAAQAVLVIESTAVTIDCMNCGALSQAAPNRLVCPACSGFITRLVAGDELRLRRVELRRPPAAALP